MRFRLFPNNLEGVGNYRIIYPYGHLEAIAGHACYFEAHDASEPERFIAPEPFGPIPEGFDADVYVFQYRMEKFFRTGRKTPDGRVEVTGYGMPELIDWLHAHGKTVVSEMDDLIIPGKMPVGAPGHRNAKRRPDLSYKTLRQVVERSDILTVTTPALARAFKHPNTRVLPNFLHWPLWQTARLAYQGERPKLRVGWMGVMRYRGKDLDVLKPWLADWLRKHPDVEFVSVGGSEPHDHLKIPEAQRRTLPWMKFPGHVMTTQEIDIGLVPLELTHFNQCKSYLKGLEYAACGIPCIASPTQQYMQWVDPGVNGLLARTPEEWVAALDAMVDGDAWRAMGRAARHKAEQNTIQEHWPLWEGIYENRRAVPHQGPPRVHQDVLPVAA